MIFIYSNRPSSGAQSLGKELGFKKLLIHTNRTKFGPRDTIINWGCRHLPSFDLSSRVRKSLIVNRILNLPDAVAISSSKLCFFQSMPHNAPVVPWTNSRDVAAAWVAAGTKVVCRTLLEASGGRGIVIAETLNELVNAPLYTKYVNKQDEYRVHCIGTEVIDVQRKARRNNAENTNWAIRNLANGFVYVRNGVECPQVVTQAALEVFGYTGLDFGAVDVIYNWNQDRAYVLEVNTAPGLEGTTVKLYAEAFRKLNEL